MSKQYTYVQELLPSILAMTGKGYTLREITNHFDLSKEQVKELCKREHRKERKNASTDAIRLRVNRYNSLLTNTSTFTTSSVLI